MGISYGKAAVDGVESSPLSSISSASGNNIAIAYGYPQASKGGIIKAISNFDDGWVYITPSQPLASKALSTFKQGIRPNYTTDKEWDKFIIDNSIDNVEILQHFNNAHPISKWQCKFFSQKKVVLYYDVNQNQECKKLQKQVDNINKNPNPVDPDDSGSINSNGGMVITFKKYTGMDPIPKKCYLKYIPAQNANTPAKVELLPNACLTD